MRVIDINQLKQVMGILRNEYAHKPVCPNQQNVFKAFRLCSYNDLKVVMIGQDPYPQRNKATGLAFANEVTEEPISPSLELIIDNLLGESYYTGEYKFDVTLESWAKQGILLLNSALTVEMNKIGSHTMIWRPFITSLLTNLSDHNTGIIYVLFGETAKTFKPYINAKNNYIFEYKHPAYYARLNQRFDCDVFDKINIILKQNNNTKITWYEKC